MKGYIRNDTGPDLVCTLTSTPAQTFVGATAVAHIRKPDGTVLSKAPAFDTSTGVATISWGTGDLDQRGKYYVEVQVTYSNTKIQTFGGDTWFFVADELG